MKRTLLIAAGVLVAVLLITVAVLARKGSDDPAPDTSDLVVESVLPAAGDNAHALLMTATNVLYWPEDTDPITAYFDGDTSSSNAVLELLSRNVEALALIQQGLVFARCVAPELTSIDSPLDYISLWRRLGRLLQVKAGYERLAGRYDDATETCMSLLEFADLLQRDPQSIIGYLVALSILDMGVSEARVLARDSATTVDQCRRLEKVLADLGSLSDGMARAAKMEYKVTANLIDAFDDGEFGINDMMSMGGGGASSMLEGRKIPKYIFKPNRTKSAFADVYRNMVSNAPLAFSEMSFSDIDAMIGTGQSRIKMFLSPNAVGRILAGIMVPALDSILERMCRAGAEIKATRLLLALHACKKDTGEYPATLEALVPRYIESIPVDPFDGQPFRYNPETRVLYSLGADGKDSGGKIPVVPGDRWKADDAVFEIEGPTDTVE